MNNHTVERVAEHQEFHRNMQPWPTPPPPPPPPPPSSSSWSSNEIHHNHLNHFQPQPYEQNFNNSQNNFQYHHNSNSNVHGNHYFDHNWSNSNGFGGHPPVNHQPPPVNHQHLSGRKRNWYNSNRGALPDRSGSDRYAKLYVSEVPRTATEGVIRPVFEPYGNIVEVVLLRDKRTGLQQGSCFVKYASTEEADAAIQALSYKHTFLGERMPITVKYADGRKDRQRENERPGPITTIAAKYADGEMERQRENERPVLLDKLFVASLNKLASMKEIEEIFSPYGLVEDIYIVCDDMKQSRGIAFVKFSQRDMALAAMTALNGNYIMRGCLTPLVVRFADAKKPRTGESRVNNVYNSTNFDSLPQEPVVRPIINSVDSMIGQNNQPNAPCTLQHLSSASLPHDTFSAANQEPQCFGVKQQPVSSSEKSPSQLSQTSSQLPQDSQRSFQEFQIEDSQSQQPSSEAALCGNDPQTVASDCTEAVIVDSQIESVECDWSEHTCPDGYKYYYNCTTFESRWDKPEQYALFQQKMKQQREPQSSLEVAQRQVTLSSHIFHQNLQQPPPSLTVQ